MGDGELKKRDNEFVSVFFLLDDRALLIRRVSKRTLGKCLDCHFGRLESLVEIICQGPVLREFLFGLESFSGVIPATIGKDCLIGREQMSTTAGLTNASPSASEKSQNTAA